MDSDPSGGDSNLFFLLNFLFQIYIWRFKSICQRFESLGFFSKVFTSFFKGFGSLILKIRIFFFFEKIFWNRDSNSLLWANFLELRFESYLEDLNPLSWIWFFACILLMRIWILNLRIQILPLDIEFQIL